MPKFLETLEEVRRARNLLCWCALSSGKKRDKLLSKKSLLFTMGAHSRSELSLNNFLRDTRRGLLALRGSHLSALQPAPAVAYRLAERQAHTHALIHTNMRPPFKLDSQWEIQFKNAIFTTAHTQLASRAISLQSAFLFAPCASSHSA